MKQTKPKKPTSYIGKLERKKKIFSREPLAPAKKGTHIKTLENQLDYQATKSESFPVGSSSRILWAERADKTRAELKIVSGV